MRPAGLIFLGVLVFSGAAQAASVETQDEIRRLADEWRNSSSPVSRGADGEVVMRFGDVKPTLNCKSAGVCAIKLQRGEILTDVPATSDSVRWKVSVRQQGEAGVGHQVIVLRPTSLAERAELALFTDRRVYHIDLVHSRKTSTPLLSFSYPEDEELRMREIVNAGLAVKQARDAAGIVTEAGVRHTDDLDFNYTITGDEDFAPVRVFNDGRQTFIDLDPSYRGGVPVLVVEGGGEDEVVNYRVNGSRFIVDRVFEQARLALGVDGGVVVISRDYQ